MKLLYLLDTNVISELGKQRPNANAESEIRRHQGAIALAAITWHELLHGMYRLSPSPSRDRYSEFIDDIVSVYPVLPYDAVAAEWHATQRARLVSVGKTPPYADGQIAAVAAVNRLVLVTANTSDFQHFEGLKVENWVIRS